MEGPAAEEAERLAEEAASHPKTARQEDADLHAAVYACTDEDPEPHFIGWRAEVDPNELFASGRAWGVTVRRVAAVTD
jgi:hypothetical protein